MPNVDKTITAIVPMRHSSERVPGKNYRLFAGKPLFYHIIETMQEVEEITKIVIDTDSPDIKEMAARDFPEVILLDRPDHLKDGAIPMNDVLLNITKQVESDFYFQTHSTNPVITTTTISRGLQMFLEQYPIYDSLFSVTAKYVRYWDGLGRAINHNPAILLRTQDLPPVYEENSCMYIFTEDILKRKHNRVGDRPYLFEMPEIESQDIDVELNFVMAEYLFKQVRGIK